MLTPSHRFRWTRIVGCVVTLALMLATAGQAVAQEAEAVVSSAAGGGQAKFVIIWLVCLAGSIAALVQAYLFYKWVLAAPPGNDRMIEIAGFVREGANAYLRQQYIVVAGFFVVIVGLLSVAAFGLDVQSEFVPFAFLTGGFFSGLAGWIGMRTATMASNRTTEGARNSLNQGLQVAFRSGAVMGLTVVGLGLLDITLWFGFLYWIWPLFGFEPLSLVDITVTMLCFGMGASSQALFARVGGGIFTKAADVGADLVGKVEQGIPEDDPRNPATIADNVGDNVGDVAGMGADLYESYCGSILATAALGVAAYASPALAKITPGEFPQLAIAGPVPADGDCRVRHLPVDCRRLSGPHRRRCDAEELVEGAGTRDQCLVRPDHCGCRHPVLLAHAENRRHAVIRGDARGIGQHHCRPAGRLAHRQVDRVCHQ